MTAGPATARLVDFVLPSLGADMEEATILEWRVEPGDAVRRGDVVALIDTEKSEIDLEIWDTGVVAELVVEVGAQVPVGTVLARIRVGEDGAGAPTTPPPPTLPSATPGPRSAAPAGPPPATRPSPPLRSPLLRHLAEERHLDVRGVRGTGIGGRVTRHDLEGAEPPHRRPASPRARALALARGIELDPLPGSGPGGAVLARDVPAARAPAPTRRDDPQLAMRRAIAAAMARSNREIPHYQLTHDIDLTAALAWLTAANESRPVTERVLPAAVLLRATALAVAANPALNGTWEDDGFRPGSGVHLGVAVSLRGGGLVAPAILDADRLSLGELMGALRDLVARARAGRLRSSEMSAATITVTNLGDRGVDSVHGVIYPPQVALVGFGRVRERPWVVDGAVRVAPVVTATLAGDHRATDGQAGSRLLLELEHLLTEPSSLEVPEPQPGGAP